MARSRSPDIPGEHVEVAYRVVSHATVSGPPETCCSPQLRARNGPAMKGGEQWVDMVTHNERPDQSPDHLLGSPANGLFSALIFVATLASA